VRKIAPRHVFEVERERSRGGKSGVVELDLLLFHQTSASQVALLPKRRVGPHGSNDALLSISRTRTRSLRLLNKEKFFMKKGNVMSWKPATAGPFIASSESSFDPSLCLP